MRYLNLVVLTIAMSWHFNARAEFLGIMVEEYGSVGAPYPAGYMTYRVYAVFDGCMDYVKSVYGVGSQPGDPNHTLTIGAIPGYPETTSIWNSDFGGVTYQDVEENAAFCGFLPEVCFDSCVNDSPLSDWCTANTMYYSSTPNLFEESLDTSPFGAPLYLDDGSWFPSGCVGDCLFVNPWAWQHQLIMQITCPIGELKFAVNLWVFADYEDRYYCHTLEDAPGMFNGVQELDGSCLGLVYPYSYSNCEGCTDPGACNFNLYAGIDDGSCYYGSEYGNLMGTLYFDANGDSIWNQEFFDEESVGLGSLYIQELDLTLFPNSEGEFYADNFPYGTYTVTYTDPNGVYELNDGLPLTLTLPSCNEWYVPLDALSSSMLQVSGPCCIWMMDIHCQNGFNPGLWVSNLGSVPLNGTFTMTFDPVLVPSYLWGTVPYDEYADGVMTWNINDQAPGSSLLYQCHINGPGVDFIGDVFPFNMELVLYDDEGNVFYQNTWVLEPTVVCAYDPNDKYTAEPGYTEEHHFVPQEDEIEYRVRFQNTGNFPAETVVIRDTLDLDHLDLQSFYPVFASHSFSTCVEANGAVTFTFNNIMLPDSTTDEPGSQGYVVYRVRPHSDVQHMDVIHNTAYIFFDGNPPIVTNTTWHTIMDCNELGTITGPDMICEGEIAEFTFPDDYVDSIDWTINEESSGSGSPLMYTADTPGEYVVGVTVINPLCEISQNADLEVNPLPGTTIIESDGTLTAPDGVSWQWYYEDEMMMEETNQVLEPALDGYYTVETTSSNGCVSISDPVFYVGVSNLMMSGASVVPNPMSDYATLRLPQGCRQCRIRMSDAAGTTVREWTGVENGIMQLDRRGLAQGSYLLQISDGEGVFHAVKLYVINQ